MENRRSSSLSLGSDQDEPPSRRLSDASQLGVFLGSLMAGRRWSGMIGTVPSVTPSKSGSTLSLSTVLEGQARHDSTIVEFEESHAFGTSPGELVAKPAIRGATSVPDSLDKIGRDDSPSSSPSGRQSASGSFGRRLSSPFLSALRRLSSGSLSASQDDLINPMRSVFVEEALSNPLEESTWNEVFDNPLCTTPPTIVSMYEEPLRSPCPGWTYHPTVLKNIDALKLRAEKNTADQDSAAMHYSKKMASNTNTRVFVHQYRTPESHRLRPLVVTSLADVTHNLTQVLVWTQETVKLVVLPWKQSGVFASFSTARSILKKLSDLYREDNELSHELLQMREVSNSPELSILFVKFERDHYKFFTTLEYKIGVIYVKRGQRFEQQFFGNNEESPAFTQFLRLLGVKVPLKGWPHFNGGLDVKNDTSGSHSVYTRWKGNQIMYHVCTMLPHSEKDMAQVQRKRHISNDVCLVVFSEDARGTFVPSSIQTHFQHACAIITPAGLRQNDKPLYTIDFATRDDVPYFGPDMSWQTHEWGQEMRDFLFAKLLNAQNAAMQAEGLRAPMSNYRRTALDHIITVATTKAK